MAANHERIVWSPPSHGVVVIGDVLVQLWELASPTEAFRSILSWCELRKERQPSAPLWMITIVGESSTMPDAEARNIAAEFPRFFTEFVMVVEGSGFRASVVRSVLAGMSMLAPRRTAPHIVDGISHGSLLLASLSQGAINPNALGTDIGQIRQALRSAQ
jgi:hypothetical protein